MTFTFASAEDLVTKETSRSLMLACVEYSLNWYETNSCG